MSSPHCLPLSVLLLIFFVFLSGCIRLNFILYRAWFTPREWVWANFSKWLIAMKMPILYISCIIKKCLACGMFLSGLNSPSLRTISLICGKYCSSPYIIDYFISLHLASYYAIPSVTPAFIPPVWVVYTVQSTLILKRDTLTQKNEMLDLLKILSHVVPHNRVK